MKMHVAFLAVVFIPGSVWIAHGQEAQHAPRSLTLQEAVDMALQHNHLVKIAAAKIREQEHVKEIAHGAYYPTLKNESSVLHITALQNIEIPAGSLGIIDNSLIPPHTAILQQGGLTLETSGTQLSQPLTTLLKIKDLNAIARSEVNAARAESQQTQNQVALTVHQLYYRILIAENRHDALEARIRAAQELEREQSEQFKQGSVLEESVIESRVQGLQVKQELLTSDLQLSDLRLQLNDVIGLPLSSQLTLTSSAPEIRESCGLEECQELAVASHPEILQAQQAVEKATAAVRLAKREYIPDTGVFARYSYQNDVPFLVHNFGTFGFLFKYDIFDGGRKRATVEEHKSQLEQAKENQARVKDEIELKIQTAFNKMERTRQMVDVSKQLLALREETLRVAKQHLQEGALLQSQFDLATAQELDAKTALLQSQLDYVQAGDEMEVAIGRAPH